MAAPHDQGGTGLATAATTVEQPSGSDDASVALRLHQVTVRFGGITALSGVDLEVGAGEVHGLIGPNGAGKTTLFGVISGVRTPDEGTVHFEGRDITKVSAVGRARRGLRRTFQRVQTFGWLTVEQNAPSAIEWRGGGGGLLADLVAFPTRRRREKAAGSLPIGLARMVELARAIADEPRVLLLDEPTSGLDETEVKRLGERIRDIRSHGECAVVLVEHDVGFVMAHCDRITVLDLGEVLAVGEPPEIKADPKVRAAYLGEA